MTVHSILRIEIDEAIAARRPKGRMASAKTNRAPCASDGSDFRPETEVVDERRIIPSGSAGLKPAPRVILHSLSR